MSWVPLRQTVTVLPPGSNDPWADPQGSPFTLKCRLQEETKVITDKNGREVVSSAQIFFDRYAPVSVDNTFEYEDESGSTKTYTPHNVARKRWLNGKTILTVVYV